MVAADGHEPAAAQPDVPRDRFHGRRRYRRGVDIREHEQIAAVEACPVGEHLGRTTLDGKPGSAQRRQAHRPARRSLRSPAPEGVGRPAGRPPSAAIAATPAPASRNARSQSGLVATTTRRGRDGLKIEANDASQCRGIGGGGLGARRWPPRNPRSRGRVGRAQRAPPTVVTGGARCARPTLQSASVATCTSPIRRWAQNSRTSARN